jgi:hypothetical protein
LLKIAFLNPACIGQAEKLEQHRIPDEIPRAGVHLLDVDGGFLFDGRLVATRQQALVVEGVDLTLEGAT